MASELYDKQGNRLYCRNGTVFLVLAEGTQRAIGMISGETFRCYRKAGKHTFHTEDSIGFNYSLIKHGKFKFIEVELSDGRILQTSRRWIEAHGTVRHFKGQGFELQYFLPFEEFKGFNEPELEKIADG